jgi:hypothetical protein
MEKSFNSMIPDSRIYANDTRFRMHKVSNYWEESPFVVSRDTEENAIFSFPTMNAKYDDFG